MAAVLEEKYGVMGMKKDLLLLLSVDPCEVKADCCCTFATPVGPLYLIFIIDETTQTWIFRLFKFSTLVKKAFERIGFNEYILNHTELLL